MEKHPLYVAKNYIKTHCDTMTDLELAIELTRILRYDITIRMVRYYREKVLNIKRKNGRHHNKSEKQNPRHTIKEKDPLGRGRPRKNAI